MRRAPGSSRKSSRRKHAPLLVNGVSALIAGSGLWVLSLMLAHQTGFQVAARALLAPAWMALALGAALLLLHVVIRRRTRFEAAMLLRQHSTFLEPMPPVVATPRGPEPRAGATRRRRRSLNAE